MDERAIIMRAKAHGARKAQDWVEKRSKIAMQAGLEIRKVLMFINKFTSDPKNLGNVERINRMAKTVMQNHMGKLVGLLGFAKQLPDENFKSRFEATVDDLMFALKAVAALKYAEDAKRYFDRANSDLRILANLMSNNLSG